MKISGNEDKFKADLLQFMRRHCYIAVGHPCDGEDCSPNLIYHDLQFKNPGKFTFKINGNINEAFYGVCKFLNYESDEESFIEYFHVFTDVRNNDFTKELRLDIRTFAM